MKDRQCICILADGARADLFEELLSSGQLPNISRYIVERGNYTNGVSVFPSTTGPAYTPYLLGKFPGHCNLPGIRWFDRNEFDKSHFSFKGFRSYIGPETYFMNHDICTNGSSTLFELIPRSVSILNEITRGITNKGDKTRFIKLFYKVKSHFTKSSNEVDDAAGKLLMEALKENPLFVFCVFLGIDTYSHQFHPFHTNTVNSYFFLDRKIGMICKFLKEQGKLDDTLILIGSDHGLTSTHSHFDSPLFMDNLGYKTLYYTNVLKNIFDADASIMISGNSMAHIYVRSSEGWERTSYFDELGKLVNELLERPEIDIVAGRTGDGKIRIKSFRGEADCWWDNNKINYVPLKDDPFDYGPLPKKFNTEKSLDLTIGSNYPDALLQILQLFESPRTGDIVVSAKPGIDLRARDEIPEHCSSHGSLVREHMIVPILSSHKFNRKNIRTVDIYPTVLDYMGIEIPPGLDGKTLIG